MPAAKPPVRVRFTPMADRLAARDVRHIAVLLESRTMFDRRVDREPLDFVRCAVCRKAGARVVIAPV